MPAAVATLQLNPETDWMYTADAGKAGLGLTDGRMMMPRGRMLGGSSGINYMAYVRGHPGDFDSWAADGRHGLELRRRARRTSRRARASPPSGDIVVDADAHNTTGPLGVSVRSPVIAGAQEFVDAAVAAGIPAGDYNGRDRGGPAGVVSLLQTTTRQGKRSSTYHAFLEGDVAAATQPHGDHRRPGDPGALGRRPARWRHEASSTAPRTDDATRSPPTRRSC